MNTTKAIYRSVFLAALIMVSACEDLSDLNINENGANQETANPNLMMPTVLVGTANAYLDLGIMDIAGVMQHTQKTGWYSGHNSYDWTPRDWSNWYGHLRTNEVMYKRAVELNWPFHQGVALTMRAFNFGVIADLWGDAPYTNAIKGNQGGDFIQPEFDSQEVIYDGIIEELKTAASLFATGDNTGVLTNYDVYYGGDMAKWQKFANSLLLRYYMRISDKKPQVAESGIVAIFNSGIYIAAATEEATMSFIGANATNSFPTSVTDDGTRFRNPKAATTLLDKLVAYDDPRLAVWFNPVRVQWVEDAGLGVKMEANIRRNGVLTAKTDIKDAEYRAEKAADPGVVYTRRFNPALFAPGEEMPITGEYVGIPPGIIGPDYHNFNPTPGQTVENQHVSQLDDMYRSLSGNLLKARLMSAAETHFILAEAGIKGWAVGDEDVHYANGIQNSLQTWGVAGNFANYITEPGVAVVGDVTLEQVIEQKWIASWTSATEAWFDYRRTGLPELVAGTASPKPVLPVRFMYSDDELFKNEANAIDAISRLQATTHSVGVNSQWSKSWVSQGTGKPW